MGVPRISSRWVQRHRWPSLPWRITAPFRPQTSGAFFELVAGKISKDEAGNKPIKVNTKSFGVKFAVGECKPRVSERGRNISLGDQQNRHELLGLF
jgi:hypothetical protein